MPRPKKKTASTTIVENKTYSFNLIDCPWIWVLKTDGKTELVSLHDLFDQADSIYSLANENIYVNASILIQLNVILHTSYSRDSKTRGITNNNKFVYYKDVILNYLDSVHDRFDLYDAEHPFMQVKWGDYNYLRKPKSGGEEGKDISLLDPFASSENKKSQWTYQECDDAWVARNFITYRLWHVGVNGKPRIRHSFLIDGFSLVFITGDTLADTLRLNFNYKHIKKTLHPIWEESFEDEKIYTEARKESVVENKISGSREFYNAFMPGDWADMARILTYSNVYLSINPVLRKFNQGYHLPIKLFDVEKEGKDTYRKEWSKLKEVLDIYPHSVFNKSSYSIQKEIIERSIDDEYLLNAKNVILVRPPEMGGMKTDFKEIFMEPVSLVGNGLLESDVDNREKLYSSLGSFCRKLEKTEEKFKNLKNLLDIVRNKDKDKEKKDNKNPLYKPFDSMLSSCTKYAEEKFFELIAEYSSTKEKNFPFEKEKDRVCKQVWYKYITSYKLFIRDYCPDIYFILNSKSIGIQGVKMSNLDRMKEMAKNLKACWIKDGKDLVQLRNMRCKNYNPTPDIGISTFGDNCGGSHRQHSVLNGLRLSLYLLSNHQYLLGDGEKANVFIDEDKVKEEVYYTHTFGYLLYKLEKTYGSSDAWNTKLDKYRRSADSLENLVRFILLTTKEAVEKGIKVQLDYGRLAYQFSRILENKVYTSELLDEVLWCYREAVEQEARQNNENQSE